MHRVVCGFDGSQMPQKVDLSQIWLHVGPNAIQYATVPQFHNPRVAQEAKIEALMGPQGHVDTTSAGVHT